MIDIIEIAERIDNYKAKIKKDKRAKKKEAEICWLKLKNFYIKLYLDM